jgi:hypothetical protein
VLNRFPGRIEVLVLVESIDEADPSIRLRYVLTTPGTLKVACTPELRAALEQAIGSDHFQFYAATKRRVPPKPNGNGMNAPHIGAVASSRPAIVAQ